MPKTVSDKKRAANRRNVQKSTGPKTAKGKACSARNALKHGLLAKDVVIDTPDAAERQSDFDALLADLIAGLQPQGIIEETLVERIATCYWRLRRAHRLEVGAIRGALDPPDPHAAPTSVFNFSIRHSTIDIRQSAIDNHRCHNVTPEKNVLAKRSHLTPTLHNLAAFAPSFPERPRIICLPDAYLTSGQVADKVMVHPVGEKPLERKQAPMVF